MRCTDRRLSLFAGDVQESAIRARNHNGVEMPEPDERLFLPIGVLPVRVASSGIGKLPVQERICTVLWKAEGS